MTEGAKQLTLRALKLRDDERLALALALWQSLSESEPVVASELEYARKKLAEHQAAPEHTLPWAEAKRRLSGKTHS